jgi:hypothetical protein
VNFLTRIASYAGALLRAIEELTRAVRDSTAHRAGAAQTDLIELGIQREQTRIQRWAMRWAALAFCAATIYAGIAFFQWKETRNQTRSISRAWLGYQTDEPSKLPVAIEGVEVSPQLSIRGHYTIKNFGNGPAIKVMESLFVVTRTHNLAEVQRAVSFPCEAGKHFATGTVPMDKSLMNPGPMGFVMFPQQTYGNSFNWQGQAEPDDKWAYVVGCVAYLDQFNDSHWTRFVVLIGDGNHPLNDSSPRQIYSLFNDTDETVREPMK